MVFVIEVSFYLHQHTNISFFKGTLIELAESYGCDVQYFMEEMRGKKFVSIHVVHFPSEITDAWRTCDYIKEIKKVKQVLIESVYYDEMDGQILYASKEYLKTMDKNARESIEGKCSRDSGGREGKGGRGGRGGKGKSSNRVVRERSYSESEILVLNALNKHKKSNKQGKKMVGNGVGLGSDTCCEYTYTDAKPEQSSMAMSYEDYLGII
jgi:hypothetical protein